MRTRAMRIGPRFVPIAAHMYRWPEAPSSSSGPSSRSFTASCSSGLIVTTTTVGTESVAIDTMVSDRTAGVRAAIVAFERLGFAGDRCVAARAWHSDRSLASGWPALPGQPRFPNSTCRHPAVRERQLASPAVTWRGGVHSAAIELVARPGNVRSGLPHLLFGRGATVIGTTRSALGRFAPRGIGLDRSTPPRPSHAGPHSGSRPPRAMSTYSFPSLTSRPR